MRAAGLLAVSVLVLAACHLADEPEVNCPPGQHPDMGRCKVDDPTGTMITIRSCNAVSPTSVTTKADGLFRFKNDDTVDHVVSGIDGQVWVSLKAGTTSDYFGITKVGSWQFDVDTCKKVGVVVVQ